MTWLNNSYLCNKDVNVSDCRPREGVREVPTRSKAVVYSSHHCAAGLVEGAAEFAAASNWRPHL